MFQKTFIRCTSPRGTRPHAANESFGGNLLVVKEPIGTFHFGSLIGRRGNAQLRSLRQFFDHLDQSMAQPFVAEIGTRTSSQICIDMIRSLARVTLCQFPVINRPSETPHHANTSDDSCPTPSRRPKESTKTTSKSLANTTTPTPAILTADDLCGTMSPPQNRATRWSYRLAFPIRRNGRSLAD